MRLNRGQAAIKRCARKPPSLPRWSLTFSLNGMRSQKSLRLSGLPLARPVVNLLRGELGGFRKAPHNFRVRPPRQVSFQHRIRRCRGWVPATSYEAEAGSGCDRPMCQKASEFISVEPHVQPKRIAIKEITPALRLATGKPESRRGFGARHWLGRW